MSVPQIGGWDLMSQEVVPISERRRRLRTLLLAVGIPIVVIVGGLSLAYVWFTSNSAEATVAPIAGTLTSVGGRKICDSGDGGHTGLNNQPWYGVYYFVPDETRARAAFFKAAAKAGYPLSRRKLYAGAPDPYGIASNPSGDGELVLGLLQHQTFSPSDCNTAAPIKGVHLSGSQAVFDITFYGRAH